MATSPIFMVFDRQTGDLVPGFNGSVFKIPTLAQDNVRDLQIQFVDRNPTGGINSAAYLVANMAAFTLACYVSAQPKGTGGPTAAAQTTSFNYNVANGWFAGSLNLNTSDIDNLIGSNPSILGYLEFDISFSGNVVLSTQDIVTLRAVVNKSGGNVPIPAASYPTTDQANSTYYPISGRAGLPVTLISAGGTIVNLYANDDGSTREEKQ